MATASHPSFVDAVGVLQPGTAAERLVRRLVADGDAEARLRAHRVPIAAAAGLLGTHADVAAGERLVRARDLALRALGDGAAVPGGGLGPLWSGDVDVYVPAAALDGAAAGLRAAGFIALDGLLERLGRAGAGRRFAAVDGTEVLAAVELEPAPADVLERARGGRLAPADAARRRIAKLAGERRQTLRGLLELLAMLEQGGLPEGPEARRVVARAGALATALGEPHLVPVVPSGRVPSRAWTAARVRGVRQEARRRARPRRVRVAFSGIDGAGKSTQAERLVEALGRCGVPAVSIWSRLGWGGSSIVSRLAGVGQRILPAGTHSAQTARATGTTSESARTPLTRRGPIGWSWAMAVTLDYLAAPVGTVRRARGAVIVFDRGLPDALIGLDEDYGGALDLSVHRRLIERFAQKPDMFVYLRLSAEESMRRKDDLFTTEVLAAHAARYDEIAEQIPGLVVLDATLPPEELTLAVLRQLAG